jgi:hypothetical protein
VGTGFVQAQNAACWRKDRRTVIRSLAETTIPSYRGYRIYRQRDSSEPYQNIVSESEIVQEEGQLGQCFARGMRGLIAQPKVWRGKAAVGVIKNTCS